MKKFFSKKGIVVIVIAIIIGAVTGVSLLVNKNPGIVTNSVETMLKPFKVAVASVAGTCEKLYGYMHDYDRLMNENSNLRAEISGAQQDTREIAELEDENQRLRELLDLSQRHSDYVFETAAVISWTASNWESTFTISKGSANSDVAVGDCVITSSGEIVGMIKSVEPTSSVCSSVLDTTFSASVFLDNITGAASAKGDYALMRAGYLKLEYVTEGNKLLAGDAVIASGKGARLPAGLLLGYVHDVIKNESGLGEYARISPAVDLENTLNVYVITDFEISE